MITTTPKGIEVYREGSRFTEGWITHRCHDVIIKALIDAGELHLGNGETVDAICPSEHGLSIRFGRTSKGVGRNTP